MARQTAVTEQAVVSRARTIDLALFSSLVLAGLSAAAGGIHGGVWPQHRTEGWLVGSFFAAVAAFQIGWALLVIRRPTRRLLAIGAVANAALISVWILSRTAGVPAGPHPWTPESIGVVDAITVGLEVALVALCVALARGGGVDRLAGRPTPASYVVAAAAGAALAVVGLASGPARDGSAQLGAGHERHILIVVAALATIQAGRLLRKAWSLRGVVSRAR